MVLTNIRIYLKVNEPSVVWLGRTAPLQLRRAPSEAGEFCLYYATLQLLCGLLSVLDYVFEENL